MASLVAGAVTVLIAVAPLSETGGGGHGYALSSVGVTAVLLGSAAFRRNRILPNLGVLVMAVSGIGAGVIGTVTMLSVLATSTAPVGTTAIGRAAPFGAPAPIAQVAFSPATIDGAGGSTAVVGNGGGVRVQGGWSLRTATRDPGVVVRLERQLAGGDWSATGVTVPIVEGAPLSVLTPAYATAATAASVQYRFAAGRAASAPVTVVYENQNAYRGLAATMYAYAAAYCPTTAVHVASLGGREAGNYTTGGRLIRVDNRVGVEVNLSPASQRSLAIHECSHELQWLNYGSTQEGHSQMTAAAAAVFATGANGAPAIEHAADCGAMAVEPNGYLGYGGYCTADELAAATRLLDGQRY